MRHKLEICLFTLDSIGGELKDGNWKIYGLIRDLLFDFKR